MKKDSIDTDAQRSAALSELVHSGDTVQLTVFMENTSPTDMARTVVHADETERTGMFCLLEPENSARMIELLPEAEAASILSELPAEQAAAVLNQVQSNEQTGLLARLSEDVAENILNQMRPEEADDARTRLEYSSYSAGGLMVTEFLAFEETMVVQDVIDHLASRAEHLSDRDVQYVFVISPNGGLRGVLPLRDLLIAKRQTPIHALMIPDPYHVFVGTDLTELGSLFDRYSYIGLPVLNNKNKLVGVVRRSDVEEALGERASKNYQKSQGIILGEERSTLPTFQRAKRRLSWLSVNILLNIAAASVIAAYQDTLEAAIALAVFLPIISDMSGCSGNQAVAVSLRELNLGLLTPNEIFRAWMREFSVGIINGIVLGLLLAAACWLWKGNVYLGLVVGVALAVNTLVAVSVGGLLPLLVKQFGRDPALASGPILTTITDMCGFFILLSLATVVLDKL